VVLREIEEPLPQDLSPSEAAESLALMKSEAYQDLAQTHLVITADTIVALEGQLLAKPADRSEAISMIRSLSGKENQVISAVALRYQNRVHVFHAITRVFFRSLEEWEIEYYVDQYQPFDKAGAYGIQEWIGMVGIDRIEGDYYNVVGLPVPKLWTELKSFVPDLLKQN
jgi:septum formation protein